MNDINKALDQYQLLNEQNESLTYFKEWNLFESANIVLGNFLKWANEDPRDNEKAQMFKEGVAILGELLKGYKEILATADNDRRKAVYYQMKYESVMMQERTQDAVHNYMVKLVDENEQLKNKLK